MMRSLSSFVVVSLLAVAIPGQLEAQDAEREVRAVVDHLFDGMRARDTAAIRATFHPDFRLAITSYREGQPAMRLITGDAFIASIGRGTEAIDEQIADVEIRIDDNLAMVWNRYVFYIDKRIDHCGVDAFTIVRTVEGWKVLHVADTQRTEGCQPFSR